MIKWRNLLVLLNSQEMFVELRGSEMNRLKEQVFCKISLFLPEFVVMQFDFVILFRSANSAGSQCGCSTPFSQRGQQQVRFRSRPEEDNETGKPFLD